MLLQPPKQQQSMEVESFIIKESSFTNTNLISSKKTLFLKVLILTSLVSLLVVIYLSFHLQQSSSSVKGDDDVGIPIKKTNNESSLNFSNISDYFETTIAHLDSFCESGVKHSDCTCKNPLEPSRPPAGTDYGDQWEVAWKRNVNLVKNYDKNNSSNNNKKNSPVVVFLGDSITEHFLGTELGQPDPNEQENAHVFQEFFGPEQEFPGLALGIAGDRCNNLLFRLQNDGIMTSDLEPAVFWILVGTNDLGEDQCSVHSIVAGVLAIVQRVQHERPNAMIVVNSLLPRSIHSDGTLGTEFWPSISSINHLLQSFIEPMNNNNVYWFDATPLFLLQNDNSTMNTQLMPDLLHPSASGSRIWCREIVKTLRRLINE